MPGPLVYFKTVQALRAWARKHGIRDVRVNFSGPGYYYHRGKGRFSKYNWKKDANYHATFSPGSRKKTPWWKRKKVGSGLYRHTTDSRTKRRRR